MYSSIYPFIVHRFRYPFLPLFIYIYCGFAQENSRSGAEKSHQRVITESKHLSSRKEVVKKRQQRILGNAYSDGTGGESEVPVSGTLAPFSLLLQVK